MTTELTKAAQQALDALDALTALMPNKDDPNHDGHDARDVRKWRALVERLRAFTQRPAAQEVHPLASRCYAMSEPHLSGYRLVLGFETLEAVDAAHTWVANVRKATQQATPEPGVPESPCQLRKRFEQHMRDVFACKDTAFLSIDGGKTYLDGSMDNHWRTWLAASSATPEPVGSLSALSFTQSSTARPSRG